MSTELDSKIPPGPLEQKWDNFKLGAKLIAPNNKRKYTVLVVGSGLAGASAAATLAEQGYDVKCVLLSTTVRAARIPSPRRAGINAAKNYQNDGDSVDRLFYDTIKGGDFRSREANVYRLAQVSTLDHRPVRRARRAVRARIRRTAGQPLVRRRAGVAHVLRAGPDRASSFSSARTQALERQIALGAVKMYPKTEMLDLVVIDGHAKGIVTRDLVTGQVASFAGDTVVLATGGYGNAYYLSTNAKGCNVTATYRAHKRGAYLRQPMLHADPSDMHPGGG